MGDPTRTNRIGMMLLTGGIGFLAGIVGGLAAVVFAIPDPPITFERVLRRITPTAREESALPALAPLHAATVDIFLVDVSGGLPTLLPLDERTGRGVALTNDGWVATVREALGGSTRLGSRHPVVVGRDRRIRVVDRIAFDPMSRLAFLHVDALDASVLPLRNRSTLDIGTALFAPKADGGLAFLTLETATASAATDTVHSSDTWSSVLTLTFAPTELEFPVGTPVVDRTGAVVGIRTDELHALPVELITSALPSLFARGAIERNVLGVTYHDASALAHAGAERVDGIILARPTGGSAVDIRSPLHAKLAEGDVILAVGDDSLTAQRFLPELLQEYPLGATVRIRARRKDQPTPMVITVPLRTARGATLLVPAPRQSEEGS